MSIPMNLLAAGLYVVVTAVVMAVRGGLPPLPRNPKTLHMMTIGCPSGGLAAAYFISPVDAAWPTLPMVAIIGLGAGLVVAEIIRHDAKEDRDNER